jgi:hypothetical protein
LNIFKIIGFGLAFSLIAACGSSVNEQEKEIEKIKYQAHEKNQNDPTGEAKFINKAIDSSWKDSNQPIQKVNAAYVFIGYYAKYSLGYKNVCLEQGVNLIKMPNRFNEFNEPLLVKTGQVIDINESLKLALPIANKSAKESLEKGAVAHSTDLHGMCIWAEENGFQAPEESKPEYVMPNIYAELMKE